VAKLRGQFARRGITADNLAFAALMVEPLASAAAGRTWKVMEATDRARTIALGVNSMMHMARLKLIVAGTGTSAVVAALLIVGALWMMTTVPLFSIERSVSVVTPPRASTAPVTSAPATLPAAIAPAAPLAVTSANGMTVALLGVLPPHNEPTAPWQSPDGRQPVGMPFRRPIVYLGGAQPTVLYIAFKIIGLPPAPVVKVPGGTALGDMDTWMELEPRRGFAGYPWAETIDGRRRLFCVVSLHVTPQVIRGPGQRRSFQHPFDLLRLYIAGGPWRPIGEVKPAEAGRTLKIEHDDSLVRSTITFAGLEAEAQGASMATFKDPTAGQLYVLQVHAIDAAGTEHRGHPPEGQTIGAAMKKRNMQYVFPVTPAEVRLLRVFYRRYEVVEVTDVAMQRGTPSEVKMTIHPPATQPSTSPSNRR
jgi:hypothetical protein